MAKIEETFEAWRATLKSSDDSIFYYHPDLERILLGLAIYTISSGSIIKRLGKNESLALLNIYVTALITAWIYEDDDAFEQMFGLTMPVAEVYMTCLVGAKDRQPSQQRDIMKPGHFFSYAVGCGGDVNPKLAQSLLDDLSTDGQKLYSPKIQDFGAKIFKLIQIYGIDIPVATLNHLNGW